MFHSRLGTRLVITAVYSCGCKVSSHFRIHSRHSSHVFLFLSKRNSSTLCCCLVPLRNTDSSGSSTDFSLSWSHKASQILQLYYVLNLKNFMIILPVKLMHNFKALFCISLFLVTSHLFLIFSYFFPSFLSYLYRLLFSSCLSLSLKFTQEMLNGTQHTQASLTPPKWLTIIYSLTRK
jgi:hypothetical protein